ncbi:MAG TPA: LptF/LptG family permease, partial [Candidatus Kapabacteria bacterium]|nr:LptF/LptG family permease [Candidatus Kapabacteria bacterium]
SDMQQIVNESMKYVEIARNNKSKTINAHLDYILHSKTPLETDESRVVSSDFAYIDTSWQARTSRITQRLSFLETTVRSNSYAERDYTLRANQYLVEIYKKYAIPFACFVFVFVGCPLGIIARRGNFGISASISLGFYIFYWACLIGGEKLADRGFIEPWLAMWAGNIIIGIVGILLTLRTSYETLEFLNISKYFKRKVATN